MVGKNGNRDCHLMVPVDIVLTLEINDNQVAIVSITAMLCYESEPIRVTELSAKWLIILPDGKTEPSRRHNQTDSESGKEVTRLTPKRRWSLLLFCSFRFNIFDYF